MIKIYHNEIELPVKSDTLTIVSKNSVFSDSFSLEYSKHPFLVIENSKTVEALGSRHISSLNKKKEYEVRVFQDNKVYFGKLKVISYVNSARKCNLVYGSEILKILDKQIADFMPTVYLGGQIPYTEITDTKIPQQPIIDALALHEKKAYPEVDFQFPEIYAPDFVDKKGNSEKWSDYKNYLNLRSSSKMEANFFEELSSINFDVQNFNTLIPCVFMLSVLDSSFNSINFKVIGDIKESTFFKCLLLLSKQSNMSIYNQSFQKISKNYNDFSFPSNVIDFTSIAGRCRIKLSDFGFGKFKIKHFISHKLSDTKLGMRSSSFHVLLVDSNFKTKKEIFSYFKNYTEFGNDNVFYEGTSIFEVTSDNINQILELTIGYGNLSFKPSEVIIEITNAKPHKDYMMFHPTFDLSRHVPNWTVSQYINNIGNLFNLKVDIDDSLKQVKFSFASDYANSLEIVDLSNYKLEVRDYINNQSDIFKVSYANNNFIKIDDNGISKESVTEKDAVIIENDFIPLPFNGTHHKLKKDDLDEGVVLLLNKDKTHNTTDRVNGQSLNLEGFAGVGEAYWKDWVNFRKNSSALSLVGEIFKHDLIRIDRIKKVYYNNIVFLVEEMTNKENNGRMETVLKVHSKVF